MAFVLISAAGICNYTFAQPPGTMPPRPPAEDTEHGEPIGGGAAATSDDSLIQPRAFMVLDAAGNPVMMPGMSFETLDRLMRIEEGLERTGQEYSIESMSIVGRVEGGYAELTVTTRITVEPTDGAWVTIPLRMSNFHRTGPADVSGIESYRMDLDDDGGGHVLRVLADTRRSVVVAMRVVVRVSASPTAAIEFRLPNAVCDIELNLSDSDVSASVVGRGDEVIRTINSGRTTSVTVESGGGSFSVRFGTQLPVVDNRPVLESDSQILVDWLQGDNSPLSKITMRVRNLRGDLPKVSLVVPGGVRLLQQPEIKNGGPFEVLDAVDPDAEKVDAAAIVEGEANQPGRRIDLVPTATRGDTQVEVSLDGQMMTQGGRPGAMVILSPILTDDAIQQKGTVEVRTPRDFRLRWTPHPWVRSVWEKADSDSMSSRVYRFRYDRVPFELPIWLSARARQMRVESDLRLTLYDSLASLQMSIKTTGSMPDARILPIKVGDWTEQTVLVANTTTPVEVDRIGDMLEIDLSSLPGGGNEGERIELVLVKRLTPGETIVDLALPQISQKDESIGTLPSTLSVISQNDSRFVIDLPASTGVGEVLRRSVSTTTGTPAEESVDESRYTLPDIAQSSKLKGYLIRERPSAVIQADAEISVVADRITEVMNWVVTPQGSLRGRLPIAWGDPSETASPSALSLSAVTPWTVSVDDTAAIIRVDASGGSQIFSDRLASGPHRIQLRRSRTLPSTPPTPSDIAGIQLPRPNLADVTLRGPVTVRLRGSNEWELTAAADNERVVDEIKLAFIPKTDLRIQIKPIEKQTDDIVISRGVLRTAVGDATQYEQFLASVSGSDILRVGLSDIDGDVLARAFVDGVPAEVLRDANNRCLVRLGDNGAHRVDLRVWVRHEPGMATDNIRPIMVLPIGIERLYWQLILPQDRHMIWATPTMGRAMRWRMEGWRLNRVPLESDDRLVAWSGVTTDAIMPPGNRYLLVGVDAGSLRALMMTRQAMWLIVAVIVLAVSSLMIYVPAFRHPMSAVVGALALGGFMLILPDASVIAGQLMLVAMLIVAVMAGVRHLLLSRRGDRVLTPSREVVEQSTTQNFGRSQDEVADRYYGEPEPVASDGSIAESRA